MTIKIQSQNPIERVIFRNYTSCTTDGKFIYFTTNSNEIAKTDTDGKLINYIQTERIYELITYNKNENIYYVTARNNSCIIYKLDSNFTEIDSICIKASLNNLTSIAVIDNENRLLIASKNKIISTDLNGENAVNIYCNDTVRITSITAVCSLAVATVQCCCSQYLLIIDRNDNNKTICEPLTICDPIISLYTSASSEKILFHGLMLKKCIYPYIINFSIETPLIIDCQSSLEPENEDEDEEQDEDDDNQNDEEEDSDDEPEPPTDDEENPPNTLEQAYTDIIESIALEETAISHILNAEGEKIQKAVAEEYNFDNLIAINNNVQDTITKITMLETTLLQKLQTVVEKNK